MQNRSLLIVAALALIVCAGAAWFLQSASTPIPAPKIVANVPPAAGASPTPPAPTPASDPGETTAAPPAGEVGQGEKDAAPPMAAWEKQIDQVLSSPANERDTAQILINMLPGLPPEGQADAAQHVTNLLLDEDYSRVMPLVRNTNLSEETHEVLVTDLMNREEKVMLPALLEIARLPNHPHHEEARDNLQIFLDEDHGTDWAKWDSTMRDYLKKQAAEEAEEETPDAVETPVTRPPVVGAE